MRFAVLLLAACAHAPVRPGPLITIDTVAPKPACYLVSPPRAPELPVVLGDTDDIVSRAFIHVRDYTQMISWAKDTEEWMGHVKECIERLTTYP